MCRFCFRSFPVSVVALMAISFSQDVEARPGPSIVEVAKSVNEATGEFSTLISALDTADLVNTLNGNRQFTVFAPTDEAFLGLGLDKDSVRDVPVDTLTGILLYHVSPGRRLAEDVLESDRVRMLNKSFAFPSLTEEGAFINSSEILIPDVEASNGVIHVIGDVLTQAPAAQSVPEPTSVGLLLLGIVGTLHSARRRAKT